MRRYVYTILFVFLGLLSYGAEQQADSLARITGIVRQEVPSIGRSDYNVPVAGCVVQLFYETGGRLDSLYTTTSDRGRFSFRGVPVGRVVLRLRCLGFETQSGVYDLGPGENAFIFTMKEQSEELEGAEVVAEIPLMRRLQDTTIFNTQAIRSLPGDDLRSVLEQLPGFRVSQGGITVDGVPVSRTYVNGMLIFGDGVMRAVDALMADEVTQVKVYDEQSALDRHRGLENSLKQRVINIITKDVFLSMSQAAVAAEGGMDSAHQGRYGGAAGASFDSEMMNYSVSAWGSNLNRQDLVYSPPEYRSFLSHTGSSPLKDYNESFETRIDYLKIWKDRNLGDRFFAKHHYTHEHTRSATQALTEYFATESSPAMSELDSASSSTRRNRHILTSYLSLQDTPLKAFDIWLDASLTDRSGGSGHVSLTEETGGIRSYGRSESVSSSNKDYYLSGTIDWTDNDVVKWRPRAKLYATVTRNTSLSWTVDTLATSFLRRQLSSEGYGGSVAAGGTAGVTVTLINERSRTLGLDLSARMDYNRSRSRRMTLDEWDVPSPVTDLANSYDHTRNDLTVSAVGGFTYSTSKNLNMSGSVSLRGKTVLGEDYFPEDFVNRRTFVYPEFELTVGLPALDIRASLRSLTPSLEQLSRRISDANPLVLTGGNPELKQSGTLQFSTTYRPSPIERKRGGYASFLWSLSGSCSLRPIVSSIRYFSTDTALDGWDGYVARSGSMLHTFSNASRPSWHVRTGGNYSMRLFRNKVESRFIFDAGYSQSSQFSGKDQVWIGDLTGSVEARFAYNPLRTMTVGGGLGIGYINSMDNTGKNLSSRMRLNTTLGARWAPLGRLRLKLTYMASGYEYLSGYGRDSFSHILDFELKTALFRDASLELGFQALDLLNSGSIYTSALNAACMSQTWAPTYGRYFLFTVHYKIREKRN